MRVWTGGHATPAEAVGPTQAATGALGPGAPGREAKDKTGVFTGAFAMNPVNGAAIPVFVADYVLMGYGTGAIMAVPGQDERDWEFAEVFELPIVRTVATARRTSTARRSPATGRRSTRPTPVAWT